MPLADGFGAIVEGLEAPATADRTVGSALRAACAKYSFLVIKGLQLTFEQQRALGSHFGVVLERKEQPPSQASLGEAQPQNAMEPGLLLHFDHWLLDGVPTPLPFTMLYGVTVTENGGETLLVSTVDAYRILPPTTKHRISALTVVDCYDYSRSAGARRGTRVRASLEGENQPHLIHPIVAASVASGALMLWVSPGNTDRINELTEVESESLLADLFEVLTAHAIRYEHNWRRGDLLLWDNRLVVHGRLPYPLRERRYLRRLSIM